MSIGSNSMLWNNIKRIDSKDSNVSKFVFTKDDAVVESVLYKYNSYANRTVICCSTQSGCPVGCRFCGAGDYFVRSLTSEEIVSQPQYLLDTIVNINPSLIKRLQIMFMSMGEPLLNLDGLIPALHILHEKYSQAALLISTSAPKSNYKRLREVSQEINRIGLQFSVHESTDDARNKLIPLKGKLSLSEIAIEGNLWAADTGRMPFFNYCVHPQNNTDEDADRLMKLFHPVIWQATISVICERDENVAAANERQRKLATDFEQKLMDRGFITRTFDPAGQDDIGGGCGQLWFVQEWMRNHPELTRKSVGFGHEVIHTPTINGV